MEVRGLMHRALAREPPRRKTTTAVAKVSQDCQTLGGYPAFVMNTERVTGSVEFSNELL